MEKSNQHDVLADLEAKHQTYDGAGQFNIEKEIPFSVIDRLVPASDRERKVVVNLLPH